MTLKNTDDRWGAVSQLFHWVIVVLILVMAYIGLTMGDLPNGPGKIATYAALVLVQGTLAWWLRGR